MAGYISQESDEENSLRHTIEKCSRKCLKLAQFLLKNPHGNFHLNSEISLILIMLNATFFFQLIFAFEYRHTISLITRVFVREYLKSSGDIYSSKLVTGP